MLERLLAIPAGCTSPKMDSLAFSLGLRLVFFSSGPISWNCLFKILFFGANMSVNF